MTFTYDLSTSTGVIRSKIGDTDTETAYLTDEEIAERLVLFPDVNLCAAECCELIIARLARKTDRQAPSFGASRSQLFQHYTDLANRLRNNSGGALCGPGWSGLSIEGDEDLQDDDDFKPLTFTTDRDKNE